MKETLLLIGGSGFIGKNLANYLSTDYHIIIYDKYIDVNYFRAIPEIETFEIDLADCHFPKPTTSPHYIINLASFVSAERQLNLFDELISSNLKILLNLFEDFKNCNTLKLFIQIGSSEEYGSEQVPFKEEQREVPSSPYALVKQIAVNTAMMLYHNFGFPAMAVRPGNVFGPLQAKSKFIPYVIHQLKQGAPLNVTPCEQKRDMIYIEDFCWCIAELLKNYDICRGEIVNVSSGESIELKEVIELAKKYLHSCSEVHYGAVPYRAHEAMDLRCSVEKFSHITGKNIHFDLKKRLFEYIDKLQ